jgi:hypothetical protein
MLLKITRTPIQVLLSFSIAHLVRSQVLGHIMHSGRLSTDISEENAASIFRLSMFFQNISTYVYLADYNAPHTRRQKYLYSILHLNNKIPGFVWTS